MGYIWTEINKDPNLLKNIQSWSVENNVDGFGVNKDALVIRTKDNHIDKINTKFIEDTRAMQNLFTFIHFGMSTSI